ncbi:TerB family tellurite resistance protein [Streptomyces celluloflavus]|uniref:TerB family tellurite resistance protein n=1 Tax=Streptomyces celluloflavus TaxID=58344 RepID=A0ABW7RNV8_9ACTN|nr:MULTISPECIES: TerB family tellurite resistance protein [Streptomyces]MYU55164.1 TerB family tellurite resistance protein [Streptomyces sp. SID7805]WSK17432.1 TerB family tellurite resistance protein [Streptomyces celluloflavus]
MHKMCVMGVRTSWRTVADGEFFCPDCGGDRNYLRRTGRRRLTVLGVPLLSRGTAGPVLECSACRGHFGLDALDHPTTVRFSAMLRDAVHTVTLAVLAAGGTSSRAVRDTAVRTVRAAGFADCSEDQLLTLLAALAADTGRLTTTYDVVTGGYAGHNGLDPCGTALAIELHESLEPLAPHLAPAGRESLLLQAARIALADGSYTPAEREVLATVGAALMLRPADTARLLAAARTPS